MNPSVLRFASLAMALAFTACGEKSREAGVRNKGSEVQVYDDPAGPAKFLRLPGPILEARWMEVPVVPGARDDIGPADKRLYIVLRLDPATWPVWARVLRPAAPGDYFLEEAVAVKILPADWLAATVPDSLGRGRLLEGDAYEPDSLATSWYQGSAAVRHGDRLFMEFLSR
jgi:hypothetical protein